MKKLTIIIILLLISQSAFADKPLWQFEIELSKQNYLLHENIWLDVSITNISKDTLISAQKIVEKGIGFSFIVLDSLGNKIENLAYYSGASYNPKTYLVAPGEELYRCISLEHIFPSLLDSIGSYTIQGFIDLPFENECYFDDLISNNLSFNIVEPRGIEKEAYELLLEANKLAGEQRLDLHQKHLDKFPNSVYVEEAFLAIKKEYIKELFYQEKNDFDYVETANQILFQYPNSGDSQNRLSSIFDIDKNRDGIEKLVGKERKRFLESIISVVPNTRLAKFSKQKLQRDSRIEVFDKCESIIDSIPKWDLKIELSKEKYYMYEGIWVDLTIKNITSDTIMSDCTINPYRSRLDLIIIDSLGNRFEKIPDMIICYAGFEKETFLIEPGDKIYRSINLKSFFNDVLNHCESRYSLQVDFKSLNLYNPYEFSNLKSNKLIFDIIKLSDDEKKAQELSRKAWRMQYTKDTSNLDTQLHQELLNKYPNSIFAELSFRCLHRYTKEVRKTKEDGTYDELGYLLKLLDNYPNFGEVRGHLLGRLRDLDKNAKIDFLNKIINNHPNTRAAKSANDLLLRDSRKQVPK